MQDLRELTRNPDAHVRPGPPLLLNGENEWLAAIMIARHPEDMKDVLARIKLEGASFDEDLAMAAAASAGGDKDTAKRAFDAASRLAPAGNDKQKRRLLLVQALHAYRTGDPRALLTARTACTAPAPLGFDALCARILALAASNSSDKTDSEQALRSLRQYTKSSLDRFEPPRSTDVDLDVVTVLYFDVLRERYGARASSWSSDELEWMVTAKQLKQLDSVMIRSGPASPEAWDEFKRVLDVQQRLRGRDENARNLLRLYDTSVLRRYASKYEDLGERQFRVDALYAAALIRNGDLSAARSRMTAAQRAADSDPDPRRRILKHLYIADAIDIPSSPDSAIAQYESLVKLFATQPRPQSVFSEYNALSFDERLKYFRQLGFESNELSFGEKYPIALLEFTARFRLVSLYAASGNLRKFDDAYEIAKQQAGRIDREFELPVLTALLEVARAVTVLKFGPTPDRLSGAEKALLDVQARIERVTYPNEEPRHLQMVWQWSGRLLEPGVRTADRSMATRERLLGRIARVRGQVALATGQYDIAKTQLREGFETLLREFMVGGWPEVQADIALGLSRTEEALGNSKDAQSWADEAILSLAVVNSTSFLFSDALAATASSTMKRGDSFGAELTICRALSIRRAHSAQGNEQLAEQFFRLTRILLEEHDVDAAVKAADLGLAQLRQKRSEFWSPQTRQASAAYLDAVYAKVGSDTTKPDALWENAFSFAQLLMKTQAGAASTNARSRAAIGDQRVATLIQERDELDYEITSLDARFAVLFAANSSEKEKNIARARDVRDRLGKIDARLQELAPQVGNGFVRPNAPPIDSAAIINHLKSDQILIVFLETSPSTYIWTFSKDERPRWLRSGMPSNDIAKAIDALRCGLDASVWITQGGFCRTIASSDPHDGPETMPYRLDTAFILYKALFKQFEAQLSAREVIVAATGPIATMPLGALVTREPSQAVYRLSDKGQPDWLARLIKLTFSPLLAPHTSNEAATEGRRSDLLLAFGHPAVSGARCASTAWNATQCSPKQTFDNWCPSAESQNRSDLVRRLEPRLSTARQICQIAESYGVQKSKVFLAQNATLSNFRKSKETLSLAAASIIVFATHGIVPRSDTTLESSISEPALVLTPRKAGGDGQDDDGLLFASEIALSKINADLVILSACNSAGRDRQTGEGFAGLSRAFLFAGAKSLLVAQWDAGTYPSYLYTVALAKEAGASAGRKAEILRGAQSDLFSKPEYSHPSIWAPYMLVREY